jgi:hypothetical protein
MLPPRGFVAAKRQWRSEVQTSRHRDHRRPPGADGVDDFAEVDALQVGRGGAEVGIAELALDDVDRDALAGQLDRVSVAELVRREAASDAGRRGELE